MGTYIVYTSTLFLFVYKYAYTNTSKQMDYIVSIIHRFRNTQSTPKKMYKCG